MSKNPQLERIIEDSMGDDTIKKYLPHSKILKYSELSRYNSINDLLPDNPDFVFILYEDSLDHGHWVVVMRYGHEYEFFNSYGGKVDEPLRWTPIKTRES